jgi:hypothetical protein
MSMGLGGIYCMSKMQSLNTQSSTEAELVGVNNVLSMVSWTKLFVEGQGFKVKDKVIFQDNQSSILLETNGKMSMSKWTRHIDIRYLFLHQQQCCQGTCPYRILSDRRHDCRFLYQASTGIKVSSFLKYHTEDTVASCKECVEKQVRLRPSHSCLILLQD